MAYYNSLRSLGENILNLDDIVEFIGKKYIVTRSHLSIQNATLLNDQIFNVLGIKNPHDFCSQHYGYTVTKGIWPEFVYYDFSAATRVVKALFKIIEDREIVKASEESEETTEVTINKPLEEESELSILLPSKHRGIKQVEIEKEITFNNL